MFITSASTSQTNFLPYIFSVMALLSLLLKTKSVCFKLERYLFSQHAKNLLSLRCGAQAFFS